MNRRKPPPERARRQRGVSLVEALVALAVMAFGILGVVGMQLSLRSNGDIARQRAQAVRIAQEEIEQWRAFTTLTLPLPTGHALSYAQIASAPATAVSSSVAGSANTTYTLTKVVTESVSPPQKTLQVQVDWNDRTGVLQSVVLTTAVGAVLPELSGSLSIPSRGLNNQQQYGRHAAIPPGAVAQSNGTSVFTPPGAASGVSWVFSNTTGLITGQCNPWPGTCTSTSSTLLAGYVRFALGSVQPSGQDAEFPTTPMPMTPVIDVVVQLTTAPATAQTCYKSLTNPAYIAYYCAVPLPPAPATSWSGRSELSGLVTAASVASGNSASEFRVCRYTRGANNAATVTNAEHPLNYAGVSTSLINQNFLVIPAGDGIGSSTPFSCPGDDTSTPFINGNTLPHQPSS